MNSKLKTCLIIEDDQEKSELLKEKIEKIGFQVTTVYTAEEGFNWLKENTPFLFILEYNLPDMNGLEFTQELKTTIKTIPPFIVTARQGDARIAVEMMKTGAKDYLIEDVNFIETILHLIKRIKKETENENKLKQTEDALIESFSFNNQIISGANVGIVVYDLNLRYRVWNPYMEKLTGFPASEVIGKNPFEVFPFLEKVGARNYLNKILQGMKMPPVDYEYEISNGKKGWASDSSAPLYNSDGKIIGVISSLHDITTRKAIEESLIIRKKQLRQIIDLVPHYIYAKDIDGKFILANQAVADLYGIPVKEIIGLTDTILKGSKKEELSESSSHNVKNIIEETIIGANGNKLILETTKIPFKTVQDKISAELGVSIDISKRKEDEELIKKFSEAVKQSQNGIIISNINGNIEYSNPRFTEMTGFTAEDVKGQNLRILNSEVKSDEYYQNIWETLIREKLWKGEFYNRTKSGNFILEQATVSLIENEMGDIINYLVMLQDITTLKENELQLTTLINSIPDAIFFKDGNKKWIEANKAAINLFRLEEIDFKGKTANELARFSDIYNELADSANETDETAFNKRESYTMQQLVPLLGEDFRTYEFTKVPLYYHDGSRKGLVIIGRDITERINKEKELILAKEKAEENNRLKTAFLQNMSHEIRTPMNAIVGFSKMLELSEDSSEKQRNFTSIINNNANQLLSIITNVLTISSLETHQEGIFERKVNINGVIQNLLATYKSQAIHSGIALSVKNQLTDEHSEIYTDKSKVAQIMSNLINNAFKFTRNGTIEFGYQLKPLLTEMTEYNLIFFVKDTGIGIEEKWLNRVFDPFVQSDISENRKYGGNGIGLTIAKGLVELLGGSIWAESEREKGSTFYFSLPYKPVNINFKNNFFDNHMNNSQKILVAEDIDCNFILIEEILKGTNYTLIHAKNGNEAIEICKADTDIRLILMDIKMPVLDGYSAAKLIKEFRPGIPIIAQSAYALDSEVIKFSDAFNDYISKPINVDELKMTLKKYIY
jgi:PAS domain S-box-containing protein